MEDKDVESSHQDISEKLARMSTDDTSDWHLGFHIYLVISTLQNCFVVIDMYEILMDQSFLEIIEVCVLIIWVLMLPYSYSHCTFSKFPY